MAALNPANVPAKEVAVGTGLTASPPHRPQRAALPHWVPASGANVKACFRERVLHACSWQPPGHETACPLPVQRRALAATLKRPVPVPRDLGSESRDGVDVARHTVVGEVPMHHASQPAPLLRDGQMPSSHEFVLDFAQLGPHPLRDRDPPHLKVSASGLAANMREAQEVEGLGPAAASRCSLLGGEPTTKRIVA